MATSSRFLSLVSLLSPSQMKEFEVVRTAIEEDPMCLEHHKAHPGDKTRTLPVQQEKTDV